MQVTLRTLLILTGLIACLLAPFYYLPPDIAATVIAALLPFLTLIVVIFVWEITGTRVSPVTEVIVHLAVAFSLLVWPCIVGIFLALSLAIFFQPVLR